MKPVARSLAVVLGACLPLLAQAAPVQFTDYRAFYQSLGGNLFAGPGTELAMPCSESPRHCLWVNAMRPAFERYDQSLWTVPDGLTLKPVKGTPDIAFDGEALAIGKQRWPLHDVTNLASSAWRVGDSIDPENLAQVRAWRQGTSACLEMQYVSSGRGDRYTQVLLLHRQRLYALPQLFASCAAIREAPQNQFSYPDNSYLGPELENNPSGLQMDYLLPDGKTRVARYLLRFPKQEDPFVFEPERQ